MVLWETPHSSAKTLAERFLLTFISCNMSSRRSNFDILSTFCFSLLHHCLNKFLWEPLFHWVLAEIEFSDLYLQFRQWCKFYRSSFEVHLNYQIGRASCRERV